MQSLIFKNMHYFRDLGMKNRNAGKSQWKWQHPWCLHWKHIKDSVSGFHNQQHSVFKRTRNIWVMAELLTILSEKLRCEQSKWYSIDLLICSKTTHFRRRWSWESITICKRNHLLKNKNDGTLLFPIELCQITPGIYTFKVLPSMISERQQGFHN